MNKPSYKEREKYIFDIDSSSEESNTNQRMPFWQILILIILLIMFISSFVGLILQTQKLLDIQSQLIDIQSQNITLQENFHKKEKENNILMENNNKLELKINDLQDQVICLKDTLKNVRNEIFKK